jgi:hypothetical protein
MKKIFCILFLSVGITAFSQQVENIETILMIKSALEQLNLYDKFGTADLILSSDMWTLKIIKIRSR